MYRLRKDLSIVQRRRLLPDHASATLSSRRSGLCQRARGARVGFRAVGGSDRNWCGSAARWCRPRRRSRRQHRPAASDASSRSALASATPATSSRRSSSLLRAPSMSSCASWIASWACCSLSRNRALSCSSRCRSRASAAFSLRRRSTFGPAAACQNQCSRARSGRDFMAGIVAAWHAADPVSGAIRRKADRVRAALLRAVIDPHGDES